MLVGLLASLLLPLVDTVPAHPPPPTPEDAAARMVERYADGEYASALDESLESWRTESLNVNGATLDQLLDVPHMAEEAAQAIMAHIARHGPLQSLHELFAVEGLPRPMALRIMPWLHVDNGLKWAHGPPAHRQLSITQRAIYPVPLEPATNHASKRRKNGVLGSPLALQTRLVLTADPWLQAGLKGSKAAGEPAFSKHSPHGYGFYSGYAQADLQWPLRMRLVLGDHALRPGYGLVLGTGSLSFLGSDAVAWGHFTRARGAFASSSGQLLRGLSITLRHGRWHLLAGFSGQRVDAHLVSQDGGWRIRHLKPAGPFRTEATLRHRRTTWELVSYASAQYATRRLILGLTAMQAHYQYPPLTIAPTATGQGNRPPQDLVRAGPYFSFRTPRIRLWGEWATEFAWPRRAHRPTTSLVTGVAGTFAGRLTAGMMLYHYAGSGHTVYQRAVGPATLARHGGHGLQMALEGYLRQVHHLFATAQLHAGRTPEGRFARQIERLRLQVGWEWAIDEASELRLLVKHSTRPLRASSRTQHAQQAQHQEVRLQLGHWPEGGFGALSQGAVLTNVTQARAPSRLGWAVFQDLGYRTRTVEMRVRLGYMQLDESPAGFYIYEPGPAYAFGMRRYAIHGIRGWLYVRWQPMRTLDLWATLGHTHALAPRQARGTGAGPLEVTLQIRWRPRF